MNEADILAYTYDDHCTVYRPVKLVLPTGETIFKSGLDGEIVYEDIRCALCNPSGGKPSKTGSVIRTDVEYILFYRPEVDIKAGDIVMITHLGEQYQVLAGKCERYSSHNQLPITKDMIA